MSDKNVEPAVAKKTEKKQRPVRVRAKRKPFNIKQWGREMRSELKKVVWPTPKQVVNNSLIVVVAVVLVGAVIALFDLGANELVRLILSINV